jgi:mannosyltransferase
MAVTSREETVIIPAVSDPDGRTRDSGLDQWDSIAESYDHIKQTRTALTQLAWMLPAMAMLALALVRPTWPHLSGSELAMWADARVGFKTLVSFIHELDSPYAVLLWACTKLIGTSDLALRAPSIVLMVASAGLIGLLGSRLMTPKVGFVAGLLFAAMPTSSRYAQDVGPAALAIFAAALSTLCLIGLLDQSRLSRAIWYSLSLVVLVLSGAGSAVIIVGHLIAVAVLRRRALTLWFMAAIPNATLAVLLYGYVFRGRGGALLPASPEQIAVGAGGTILLGGILVGLGLASISTRQAPVLLTAWAFIPIAMTIGLWAAPEHWTVLAPLIGIALPGWALLASSSMNAVPTIRSVVVLGLLATLAWNTQVDIRRPEGHGQATGKVASLIAAQQREGDAVVFADNPAEAQLGRDLVDRYVPAAKRPDDLLTAEGPRRDGHLWAKECPDPKDCLATATRVWIIRAGSPSDPLEGFSPAKDGFLRVNFKVNKRWAVTGLTLYLLIPASEQ